MMKSIKPYVLRSPRREINEVELAGFRNRVKRILREESLKDVYYNYRLEMFFMESRVKYEDIEAPFDIIRNESKKVRKLKKEKTLRNL